ncbi:MAG: discoidin domain-containing protein [Candidatus Aminicenantes bacterium]|nr:MAG: discoidin domain-containing protein [Candidatus Aminicenantes bacterium]
MKKSQSMFQAFFIIIFSLIVFEQALNSYQEEESKLIRPRAVEGEGIYYNRIQLLIDGQMPAEGSEWNGEFCVHWEYTETFFILDLGAVFEVTGILLQVDGDDDYQIDYSLDGEDYFSLLPISASDGEVESGMDTMSTILGNPENVSDWELSPEQARYIKIYATEGNSAFSVSELQVFGFLATSLESESKIIQPEKVEAIGTYYNNINSIIDGKIPPEESEWNANPCVYWEDMETNFVIDLGAVFEVTGILLQVDGDDDYQIDYSLDGEEYFPLLEIMSGDGEVESGMDTMSSIPDNVEFISEWEIAVIEARFIKIFATGGNEAYSISELQIFGVLR